MEYSVNLNPKWQPHCQLNNGWKRRTGDAFYMQLLIDHFRANMRKFCHIVIGTLHKQTDSTLHLLNILDILTVNNLYQHNALEFLHLWQKGLLKWIYFKIIFNMQAVFMDTTPDMLSKNLCKTWVCNNSGEQTFAKKIKTDLDKTIENLDKGTSKLSLKVPLWNQKWQRPPKQKWKSFNQKQSLLFWAFYPVCWPIHIAQSQNPNPNLAAI